MAGLPIILKKEHNTKVLKKRHLVKAISYRLISSLSTLGLAYILTREINISLLFMSIDFVIKIILYYLHERLWYKKIKFGVKHETHYS